MARLPLYKAAETEMIRKIESGEWEPGRRLPNEFILAEEFGVSQGTMRRALMTLDTMGLLLRKPGRGTIVAEPGARRQTAVAAAGVTGRMTTPEGDAPAFDVFRARMGLNRADAETEALLNTREVRTLERTLKLGSRRAALDAVLVPNTFAQNLTEEAPADLRALLATIGAPAAQITDTVSAAMTTMAESVALASDRHTALLVVLREATDGSGRMIARQELRIVADAVRYRAVGEG